MGMGQEAIQSVTQTANTGAQVSIQLATILGLVTTQKDHQAIQEWTEQGYKLDTDFVIPQEKMFEFRLMCVVVLSYFLVWYNRATKKACKH